MLHHCSVYSTHGIRPGGCDKHSSSVGLCAPHHSMVCLLVSSQHAVAPSLQGGACQTVHPSHMTSALLSWACHCLWAHAWRITSSGSKAKKVQGYPILPAPGKKPYVWRVAGQGAYSNHQATVALYAERAKRYAYMQADLVVLPLLIA